jgi:hypothetical protein
MNLLKLGDTDDNLVPADYSDLLHKIINILGTTNPFKLRLKPRHLIIDIDDIANQVATLDIQHPLGSSEGAAEVATINFTSDFAQKFPQLIQQITEILRQHLQNTIGLNYNSNDFVHSLISPLEANEFRGNGYVLGFQYDFNNRYKGLQKQQLTLENTPGLNSLFKFHKLTISVDHINNFSQALKEGIKNHIDRQTDNEEEQENLYTLLDEMEQDDTSDFHKLIKIVDQETLGKLKKEAKICYLEYLLENIRGRDKVDPNTIYLEDLIRRLRLIEEYINNDSDKVESDYNVSYAGVEVNLREMFSRAEAFDALPIIPIVDGYLGETTDSQKNGESKFILGLKLKFDNPVQARGGDKVFQYNLNLLNPDSDEHKQKIADSYEVETFSRKVLKLAFLYYFIFASRANPFAPNYNYQSEIEYNPKEVFEQRVLPILQGSDEQAKQKLLRKFLEGFRDFHVSSKIDRLKQLLKSFLTQPRILPKQNIVRYIRVKQGVLVINKVLGDKNNRKMFREFVAKKPKKVLQYIAVDQNAIEGDALCRLTVKMDLEEIRYFQVEKQENLTMQYNIKGIQTLPIIWVPKTENSKKKYADTFSDKTGYKMIVFPYDNKRWDDKGNGLTLNARFIYKFTTSLLAYISLVFLLEKAPANLFLPMARLHEGNREDPRPTEKFMTYVSRILCQLLSEKYRANSQGFRIRQAPNQWHIRNGLSSLYSILPKQFQLTYSNMSNQWQKLAIIIVSSQDSDEKRWKSTRQQRKANLLGEVVAISRIQNETIQVEMLRTFSENYSVRDMYNEPPILGDIVSELYAAGYRHFIYVAQAPYSSNLHITNAEEDERLFFMSKSLIGTLKGKREDIKIYPIFFDKYYVITPTTQAKSFYIDDIQELETTMFQDSGRNAVMFFNLLNGIKVSGNNNFYNGAIAYSTLLNIYQGILDDEDILEGLIYDGEMRNTLLNCLLCFHFSRYESRSQMSLKLDPYGRIIGDESVGVESVFKHINGSADFNCLAFLTEVKHLLGS